MLTVLWMCYCHIVYIHLYLLRLDLVQPSSKTLLDNIFLSCQDFHDSFVLSVDISDHLPVITLVKVKSSTGTKSSCEHLTRVFSDVNITEFRKILAESNWDKMYESNDVNAAYDEFSYVVNGAYDAPLTT